MKMKKLLLASVLAIASIPGYAVERETHTPEEYSCHEKGYQVDTVEFNRCVDAENAHAEAKSDADECHTPEDHCIKGSDGHYHRPPARVTVAPPYQGPPAHRVDLLSP